MDKNCEVKVRPKSFKELIGSTYFWNPVRFTLIGGILGYLYYHFTGTNGGNGDFFSNPYMSILSGSFLGLFYAVRPCRSC